jgi:hypothetical protein
VTSTYDSCIVCGKPSHSINPCSVVQLNPLVCSIGCLQAYLDRYGATIRCEGSGYTIEVPPGDMRVEPLSGPEPGVVMEEDCVEITVMSEQEPRNNAGEETVLGPAQMCNLPSSREVNILYRNWIGEVAWRRVVPLSIRFESSQWHPVPQWIMRALDIDKEAERSFAIANIQNWKQPSLSSSPSPRSG